MNFLHRVFSRLKAPAHTAPLAGIQLDHSILEKCVHRRRKKKVPLSLIHNLVAKQTANMLLSRVDGSTEATPAYIVQLLGLELNSGSVVNSIGGILGCDRLLVDPHNIGGGLINYESDCSVLAVQSPHPEFGLLYTASIIVALGPLKVKHPHKSVTLSAGDAFIYKATSCKMAFPTIVISQSSTAAVVHHYYSKPKLLPQSSPQTQPSN